MKRDGRRSSNIDDRRGRKVARNVGIGGGAAGIIAIIIVLLTGGDPKEALQGAQQGSAASAERPPEEDALADFVSVVLADTEDTWNALFSARGQTYQEPVLVLFTDAVDSACGRQDKAVGPFYCPADQQVYIDLSFYSQLRDRLGAPGDFAQAYVVAHEVGHHIQNITGVSTRVHKQKRGLPPAQSNALSVRLELQADCYAGVWAHHADKHRDIIEHGDIGEALTAAAAIGDDTLQTNAQGYARPETFTHGTSDQRMRWFKIGLDHGSMERCDTFSAPTL